MVASLMYNCYIVTEGECDMVLYTYMCASGDWLTSRPKGCSQPRELWFFDVASLLCHVLVI